MGEAIGINPGYLKLRKIRAAQSIAKTVIILRQFFLLLFGPLIQIWCISMQIATSQNRVYLNAETLMMNLTEASFDQGLVKLGEPKAEAKE